MVKYRIKCDNCQAERVVGVIKSFSGDIIDWLDNHPDPQEVRIISGRPRLDGNFGWQCVCGNDDLLCEQEKKHIENLQTPSRDDLVKLREIIKPEKPKFHMETA